MKLDNLAIGKSAVIVSVGGTGALRQHFLDMGLIQGVEITMVKYAPMGDPIEIKIHDFELTLRKEDAQKIEVKIISSKYEEIRKAILTNVDRGVTMLHGQTGYLLENTEVLINVISTRELVQVERLVKSIDEDAFMIISNVHEVQGRGFNLEKEYIEK